MAAQMEDWEKKALDEHKRIVREFNSGKAGIKSPQLEARSVQLRIAMHLLETGGGLTAAEIKQDVDSTKGKEWVDTSPDTPLVISSVLEHMVSPGSAMKKMLESAGGFGIMNFSVTSEMNKQNVLVKNGDKYFLWCQDGIDWGAKLATAKEQLERAEKSASSVDRLEAEVAKAEAEIASLKSELDGLGMFKFSEKKALKNKIESAEKVLSSKRSALKKSQSDKAAIPKLKNAYETARNECKKNFG